MRNIFTYGSLMFDEVWTRLVTTDYKKIHAEISGFRRLAMKDETYPGLVASAGDVVAGVLRLGVSVTDISVLDQFEGDYYNRITVTAQDAGQDAWKNYQADVYVIKPEFQYLLADREWDGEVFARHQLAAFIARYSGFQPG